MPSSAMVQTNDGDRLDTVWLNARLATLVEGRPGLGIVESGAIAAREGRIVFAGRQRRASGRMAKRARVVDCEGRWITPALIDCHTHLVYGGDRAHEFELRLAGATYEQIAREGGGILSTVRATRAASEDELLRSALKRLDALIAEGVGTVEVKSGYGLDLAAERKSLRVARQLAEQRHVTIRATFLGAHALPPEFADKRDAYVAYVADTMIPALASEGLIDAVDGFCERIAFYARGDRPRVRRRPTSGASGQAACGSIVEFWRRVACGRVRRAVGGSSRICGRGWYCRDGERRGRRSAAARRVLCAQGAARPAGRTHAQASYGDGRRHRFQSGHVAHDVAPPRAQHGCDFVRAHRRRMPRRRNPQRGARAGPIRETGTLEVGKWADIAIWDIERPAELVYRLGFNPLHARVWRGR